MTRTSLLAAAMIGLFGSLSPAGAAYLFTFSGTGTGSIGTTSFADLPFLITVTSDESQVTPFSFVRGGLTNTGFSVSPSPTSIVLGGGIGVAILTGGDKVFVNNTTSTAGLQLPDNNTLIDVGGPAFSTFNLQSPLGPLSFASLAGGAFTNVATSQGILSFTNIRDVTFREQVVPEPASLAMLGVGLLGTIGLAARAGSRSRAARAA